MAARQPDDDAPPPGDLVITPPHKLYKAQQLDPFREVGTTGLRQFGGYVLEEWLSQLSGRKAAWVYREMLDNDPVVGAILFAIRWLARGVEWRVEEGADSQSAEFVEQCMDDMSHTWGDFISEALSMLPYGWDLEEITYKRRQGPKPHPILLDNPKPTGGEDDSHPATSKYDDGRIGWRKFSTRAQETLLRWIFDGTSGIAAMEQIDWQGNRNIIPIQKCLLFRTQSTRNNPEGRSVLRNAFTSYWTLKNIKQIEAIGVERDLAGIPVITPPEGVNLFAEGSKALLAKVQHLVTSIRRDEYEGVVLPSAGWTLELLSAAGSRQLDTDKLVRRYRQDIALSMLADFVLIGQDSVGSFAMVDVKSDLFGVAIDGVLDVICETLNQHAVPRLLRLNGLPDDDPPKIVHGSARKIDLERVGAFLQAISMAGAPIPWSQELLKALFTDAGLPAEFSEYEPAEDLPGQKPDPADDMLATPAAPARAAAAAPAPGSGQQPAAKPAKQPAKKAESLEVDPPDPLADAPVARALRHRYHLLSAQLDIEIRAALAQLAEHAATSYLTTVHKASAGMLHRIVGRIMRDLAPHLHAWLNTRLAPMLANHAARVTLDTQRTIQAEINLEVKIGEQDAQRIAQQAGQHLGLRDIEPQLRQSILAAIREGLAAGDNPVRTAQRIRQHVPAGRFVHAGPKYRAQLIARDQTARLQREATLASYRSNPRITAVRLHDGIFGPPRSDQACIARDGQQIPIGQAGSVAPYHPLCTLSFSPVISSVIREPLPEREPAVV